MFKKLLSAATVALCVLAPAVSQAAYMKLSEVAGVVDFYAGNNGDFIRYSTNGIDFSTSSSGILAVNGGPSTVANRSIYNTGAGVYADYSVYFVVSGLVIAEVEFDYIGSLAGLSGVQKITYNNYAAQGITMAAPGAGAGVDLRNMVLSGDGLTYSGPGGFGSQTGNLAFYNDGIVISAASIHALNNVPEPTSLALVGAALALVGASARRRRA